MIPALPAVQTTMFRERQGEVGNLTQKTNFELKELLTRQEKILSNRALLKNLPDGGAKLKLFVEKIKSVLEERGNVDAAADLLDTLSLDVHEKMMKGEKVQRGKIEDGKTRTKGHFKPQISNTFETFHSNIFNKPIDEDKFRPGRTLKSKNIPDNITKPDQGYGHERKTTTKKELSSAYFPPTKSESVKSVDLSESLSLQKLQQQKLDKLKADQAAERLAERLGIKIGEVTFDAENTGSFREPENNDSDNEEETPLERMEKNEEQLARESSLDIPKQLPS